MPISIKNLVLNTKVSKEQKEQNKAQKSYAKGMSKMDKEAIIEECMARVREMMEYELKP